MGPFISPDLAENTASSTAFGEPRPGIGPPIENASGVSTLRLSFFAIPSRGAPSVIACLSAASVASSCRFFWMSRTTRALTSAKAGKPGFLISTSLTIASPRDVETEASAVAPSLRENSFSLN